MTNNAPPDWIALFIAYQESENTRRILNRMAKAIYPTPWGANSGLPSEEEVKEHGIKSPKTALDYSRIALHCIRNLIDIR